MTLFEHQLGELVEAATPSVPLVGSTRRFVTNGIHAKLFLDVLGCFNTTHILFAATAHKEQLHVFGKTF